MRQPYRLLTLGLALCAVAAVAGAFILLNRSHTADVDAEVGKWLLTVAAALVLTGALSMVVKQIDQRRSEREAWHGILNDLVAANQKVILARVRLQAHRSAKTYQEQLAEVMRARVEARRIGALDIVNRDRSLSDQITKMREYLDELGQEYAAEYLRVARQQRLDEVWLTAQMNAANDGGSAPRLPDPLAGPTRAWLMLTDASRFPRLAALLDEGAFPIDTFRTNYKLAKECLEMHAGFGDPPIESRIYRAKKLAKRAREFADGHEERLGDLKGRVTRSADEVDKACKTEDPDSCETRETTKADAPDPSEIRAADPGEIQRATVKLSALTADAVELVYPKRERDGAAADGPPAATAEIEAHPAAPPSPRPVATDA
jgi:hypothetical protein